MLFKLSIAKTKNVGTLQEDPTVDVCVCFSWIFIHIYGILGDCYILPLKNTLPIGINLQNHEMRDDFVF